MKMVIVGPGAMGCLLAGLITRRKQAEVWLLDKDPKRAKRLCESGIKVEGLKTEWKARVPVTTRPDDIKECDLVVLCVKSYDTEAASRLLQPLLGENTAVLTLQNGLGNIEVLAEIAGSGRLIAGVTAQAATLVAEGQVRHCGEGETVIGRVDGKLTVAMRNIRELFNQSGVATRIVKDVTAVVWSKLIVSAGINAVSALTRLPNGALLNTAEAREAMALAVGEATRVAKKKRIKLLYDDPIQTVESVCRTTAKNISSMCQDVLRKKKTEIDYINGAIVRQGKSLGVAAPVNQMLTDLVKAIEAGYDLQIS